MGELEPSERDNYVGRYNASQSNGPDVGASIVPVRTAPVYEFGPVLFSSLLTMALSRTRRLLQLTRYALRTSRLQNEFDKRSQCGTLLSRFPMVCPREIPRRKTSRGCQCNEQILRCEIHY